MYRFSAQLMFVFILICVSLTWIEAVEPGKPSKTSVWVLAARAIGAHDPDPSVRNPDWLAERLLGPEERALIPDNPWILGLDRDYREVMSDPQISGFVANMLVRTKFIDEHLQQAVANGVRQVVILGAGFDSTVYRFRQLLRNVKVFEVDFGPTQEYKRRRVREVLGESPSNVVYQPIDFTRQKLGGVLRRAGYRMGRKTLFIWEGVTMYIPEEAIRETLRFIAGNSGDGSSVVFNYMSKRAIELGTQQNTGLFAMVKGWGEPWIFGLPDGAEPEFFAKVDSRLQMEEYMLISGPEAIQRYLTRKDGTRVWDVPRLSPSVLGRPESWLAVVTVAPITKNH